MFCHACGTKLPEGAAFCPNCGTRQLVSPEQEGRAVPPAPPRPEQPAGAEKDGRQGQRPSTTPRWGRGPKEPKAPKAPKGPGLRERAGAKAGARFTAPPAARKLPSRTPDSRIPWPISG